MLASADERETRGFISITTILEWSGEIANCTFEPPQSTPTALRISMEAVLIFWYSLSVRVCIGAIVIESPVWTPIGSMFSIEQTIIALSFLSRMTSISNSLHPMRDSSMRISCAGLISRARSARRPNSSLLFAIEPPIPPSVNEGLIIRGKGISSAIFQASSRLWAIPLLALSYPRDVMMSLKIPLSSAFSIASAEAPMTFTPYLSRIPSALSSIVRLRAVCPPIVESIASGPT